MNANNVGAVGATAPMAIMEVRIMTHKINVKVASRDGSVKEVVRGKTVSVPSRIVRWLFGDSTTVLVLNPGATVKAVEIHEVP